MQFGADDTEEDRKYKLGLLRAYNLTLDGRQERRNVVIGGKLYENTPGSLRTQIERDAKGSRAEIALRRRLRREREREREREDKAWGKVRKYAPPHYLS